MAIQYENLVRYHRPVEVGAVLHHPQQTVLYLLEKQPCGWRIPIVINAGGIDVRQFLIEPAFAQAYLPYFSQQVLEIVFANESPVFHALLVYDISTQRELSYHVCTPLPELRGTDGIDSIAHRDDGVKVIKQRVSCNLSFSFGLNYRDFLGSCLFCQLTTIIDILIL